MRAIFFFLGLSWLAMACLLLILASGCTANRQERQVSHQYGIKDGLPTDLTTTTETKEASSAGVDVGTLISAAVQASQGKILGALDAIKPQPLPEIPSIGDITQAVAAATPKPGTDWATLGAGTLAALLAAYAAQQRNTAKLQLKEKEVIAADRDDAYEKLIVANRQLPPVT